MAAQLSNSVYKSWYKLFIIVEETDVTIEDTMNTEYHSTKPNTMLIYFSFVYVTNIKSVTISAIWYYI